MEAGYDYLLLRGRLPRRLFGFTTLFLVCLGVLLLAGGGAYYGFVAKARADLAAMNASLPPAASTSLSSNSLSSTLLSDQDGPGASGGGGVIAPAPWRIG